MKLSSSRALTSAIVLSSCGCLFAQDQTAQAADAIPTGESLSVQPGTIGAQRAISQSQGPHSAGLLNDWMRKEDSENLNWDVGGEVRGRYESKDHFAIPGEPGSVDFLASGADTFNAYELLRSTMHLGYVQSPGARYYVEARDSRTWDDERTPPPEDDVFDLHQAYLLLGDLSQYPVTLKVGRQELRYGDDRLIGTGDWSNLGRVFDAAKFRYEKGGSWLDLFAGRVVLADDHNFNVSNDYDLLAGLYTSSVNLIQKHESQAYLLWRSTSGNSPNANAGGSPQSGGPTARDIITIGARVRSLPGALGGWDYESEVVNQYGTVNLGGPRVTQQAYALHLAGGYTWQEAWSAPRLGLEYNFSSGDSDPNDNKSETLDNLFPSNHKPYGLMDFVSWQNIHDAALTFSCKPIDHLTLSLEYHGYWLANNDDYFYTSSGAARTTGGYGLNSYDSFVGSEVNAVASYSVKSWLNIQAGYGHFFTGDYVNQSLDGSGGAADADYFYGQLQFNF